MSTLFEPLHLGAIPLKHRVVMAPLTRLRSQQPFDVPHGLNAEYYGQRASDGGLIITEATDTSEQARGYPGAPGIYTAEQVAGWRQMTMAVHAKRGYIFSQIWHTGRISHSSMQPDGRVPGAPSAVVASGHHMNRHGNMVPFETPRALTLEEIKKIIGDFRQAAENARMAGFDGVEIHSANGYLIDQFLQDHTNRREDIYGGSIPNRTRFLLEVVEQVVAVFGHDRVGVRIAPWGAAADIRDSDPLGLFSHVAAELGQRQLAYLHIVEPRAGQAGEIEAIDPDAPDVSSRFKESFGGPIIAAGGFTRETAEAVIRDGHADAVAFGRLFIANPDLPQRLRLDAPLNPYDRATFYGGDARGYTDYPYLETGNA
jgi:N-ethylmaleimide reductase